MLRYQAWSNRTRSALRRIVCAIGLAVLAGLASASPLNPDPSNWAGDTGAIAMHHGDTSLAVERSSIGSNTLPIFFGFYFDGTAGVGTGPDGLPNAGVIFDPSDLAGDHALINFPLGKVFDVEKVAVQSSFTKNPTGTGDIGFFIAARFPGAANFSFFYTDPALNSGFDLAGIFPSLVDPSLFLVAFDLPSGPDHFVAAYSVMLTGLSAIPEPTSLGLAGLGFMLLLPYAAAVRQRRRAG